jgi:hypothetical protein
VEGRTHTLTVTFTGSTAPATFLSKASPSPPGPHGFLPVPMHVNVCVRPAT